MTGLVLILSIKKYVVIPTLITTIIIDCTFYIRTQSVLLPTI